MARNYRTPCPVLAGSGVCVAPQDRVPVPFWPGGGPGMQPAQLLAQAVSHGIALASSWPSSLEETATETGCRAPQRWGARGTLGEPSCWMEQLCGTQTPSGSALPLAPCLPGTVLAPHVPVSHLLSPAGPGPQDSSPRVTRGSRGPSSRPPCISTQGEEIWLYFHSQGARSLAAGPSAAPAQPCAPVLPLQKHADNNQKEAERERKSETTALPPCSCTEQSPNEKNMAAS